MMQSGVVWKRPLITGASGQVGAELVRTLQESGTDQVLRSSRHAVPGWLMLDLAKVADVAEVTAVLEPAKPDLIVCAGAMTFVDGCEEQPEMAYQANAYGPSKLAAYAHQRNLPFVYFSSDYVFDGTPEHPGPYDESAETCPVSVYGRSKLEGEQAILRVHPEALVVRTSWVYGPDAAGKNFVSYLLRQLRAGERVRVPSDQLSTPTLNRELARVTLRLASCGYSGIVHVAGPECMSRFELAKRVARFFRLDSELIDAVPTASLGQRADRPLLSGLISHRLHGVGDDFGLRSLEDGLQATASALIPDAIMTT